MSMSINFHINQDAIFLASSQDFSAGSSDPFCTFELASGGNVVSVFLRTVDDARKLVDAAVAAYRNVEAIELEKRLKEVEKSVNDSKYKCTIEYPCEECVALDEAPYYDMEPF